MPGLPGLGRGGVQHAARGDGHFGLPAPVYRVPLEVEELTVEVASGRFDYDRYSVQTGPVRLRFVARGSGPHSVRIENLMQATLLPVGETTVVGLTTAPGEYIMMTDGVALDTAVLNVRPVGGR